MVLPPAHELAQHALVVLLLDARQDARRKVLLDGLAVVVVQLLGPVVWGLLGAHRVHGAAGRARGVSVKGWRVGLEGKDGAGGGRETAAMRLHAHGDGIAGRTTRGAAHV